MAPAPLTVGQSFWAAANLPFTSLAHALSRMGRLNRSVSSAKISSRSHSSRCSSCPTASHHPDGMTTRTRTAASATTRLLRYGSSPTFEGCSGAGRASSGMTAAARRVISRTSAKTDTPSTRRRPRVVRTSHRLVVYVPIF